MFGGREGMVLSPVRPPPPPPAMLPEVAGKELHASGDHCHPALCHQHRPGHTAGALHCLSYYNCMKCIERLGCTTWVTSGKFLSLPGLSFRICKVEF